MTTSAHEPQGIHNFRELAAYPLKDGRHIRPGMVYRSGALELMTEDDRSWLSNDVGLATILDLRHPDELQSGANSHALAGLVRPISVFPEDQRQEDVIAEFNGLYGPGPTPARYLHYLDVGGDRLAEAFTVFGEAADYPVLVHCTAGKDRTGVLIGMLMDVLGASDADIAAEYGLSDASIDRLIAYLRSGGRELQGSDAEIRARLATPPERMAGFIELLRDRYGSAAEFFGDHGVPASTIERVRELLSD
ncbi:MAG: tyrosine-protein phosphatase [Tepidiformaceae bacterium]